MSEVKEIVLTGGPCAGKSTALSLLLQKLSDWGFRVFIVPEIATTFIGNGVPDIREIANHDSSLYLKIQERILLTQLAFRREFQAWARLFPQDKVVIIYDRGPMDGKAYLAPGYF